MTFDEVTKKYWYLSLATGVFGLFILLRACAALYSIHKHGDVPYNQYLDIPCYISEAANVGIFAFMIFKAYQPKRKLRDDLLDDGFL